MKLLPYPSARHPCGEIRFKGRDLIKLSDREMRRVRGDSISIVFQEPMTSLNPLHTIEKQISEILLLHRGLTGAAARKRVIELLTQVAIHDPKERLGSYPHQLSGGQRQRVMIAMALANEPDLLIADEPTTALDVTVQAQILKLLKEIQARMGMAISFITRDLGWCARSPIASARRRRRSTGRRRRSSTCCTPNIPGWRSGRQAEGESAPLNGIIYMHLVQDHLEIPYRWSSLPQPTGGRSSRFE